MCGIVGIMPTIPIRSDSNLAPRLSLDRRDKIGFTTPEHNWLTTLRPWVEGTLNSEAAALVPALNFKEMQLEWGGIVRGRKPFAWHVWRWLNLSQWAKQFEVRFE